MNRTPLLILCGLLVAPNLSAQLPPKYRDWGDTAVQSLMTKQEKIDWAAVKTEDEAKAFIEVFWARRDPTPDTSVNEFREEIEKRIAEADKRFGFGSTPGSLTDHGLVLVLLGEPSQVTHKVKPPQPISPYSLTPFQRSPNVETWIYRSAVVEHVAGTKAFDIAFVFHDEKNASEFALDGPSKLSFDATALVVAKSVLKRPFLTAGDLASAADPDRKVALRLVVVSDPTNANEVLRRAQEGVDFAGLARKYSTHHSAQRGGYLGRLAFADLDDDFRAALVGKPPGAAVLITRAPQFAIVRLLSDAEAKAADAETK